MSMIQRSRATRVRSTGVAATLFVLTIATTGCPSGVDPSAGDGAPASPLDIFNPGGPAGPDGNPVGGAGFEGDPTLAAPDLEFAVRKGNALSLTLQNPPENPNDVTFAIVAPPAAGRLSSVRVLGPNAASITYNPPIDFVGVAQFSYVVVRGEEFSDVATVKIAVHPEVVFTAAPSYVGPELTVRAVASTVTREALPPDATYHWVINDQEFSGPMSTHAHADLVVRGAAGHSVKLFLTFAGMALPIPCQAAAGRSDSIDFELPPMVAGVVRDERGRPQSGVSVRAIGTRDFAAETGADGSYVLLLDPGWSGDVLVDSRGLPYAPAEYEFRELARNHMQQNFTGATLGSENPAAPTAAPLAAELDEDSEISLQLAGASAAGEPEFEIVALPANGVLRDPAHGRINASDLPYRLHDRGAEVRYTPAEDYFGADAFQYRAVVDGIVSNPVSATLTIRAVNDAPSLDPDRDVSYAVFRDQPAELVVVGVDVDAAGPELNWRVTRAAEHGSVVFDSPNTESAQRNRVTYTPANGYIGPDQFSIRCVDGGGAAAEIGVMVNVSEARVEANAGSDITVAAFQIVSLTADGSLAPPGTTYAWRQTSGTSVTLNGANTSRPTFRAPATETQDELEFEVSLTYDGDTSSDRVKVKAVYSRQSLLYAMHAALERQWELRTDFTVNGRVLSGFATFSAADGGPGFWGNESGSASDAPLWDFQRKDGIAGALQMYVNVYNSTGNKRYLRLAQKLGDALLDVQDALGGGWFQDSAYIDGQWRNVGVWGRWGERRHADAGMQDLFTLDDSTTQACAIALMRLYEAGGGNQYLDGAKQIGDILVNLKDVTHQGQRPYATGGFPQVLPLGRALAATYNQNADPNAPGPYMQQKTLNDNTTSDCIIVLMELHRITNDARYLQALRLNIDWLLDRQAAYGYRGWAQQYNYLTDAIDWGRGKEPPAYSPAENRVVELLLYWRTKETDATRKARIEQAVTRYVEWLANDVPRPPDQPTYIWRYYNHDPDAAAMNAPTFAQDFQIWYGAENEGNVSGLAVRGRWDVAWVDRLMVNGTVDVDRAALWIRYTADAPIGLGAGAWGPPYRSQDPAGAWPTAININGTQRRKVTPAITAGNVMGLRRQFDQTSGGVSDSDADGVSDVAEAAAGTDPRDSDSRPS